MYFNEKPKPVAFFPELILIGAPLAAVVAYGLGRYAIQKTTEAQTATDAQGNPVANPNVQAVSNAAVVSVLGLSALYFFMRKPKKKK